MKTVFLLLRPYKKYPGKFNFECTTSFHAAEDFRRWNTIKGKQKRIWEMPHGFGIATQFPLYKMYLPTALPYFMLSQVKQCTTSFHAATCHRRF